MIKDNIQFKCKGIHFPKQEGDKWVCMYCNEKVEDPNKCELILKVTEPKINLCNSCIHSTKTLNTPAGEIKMYLPFCSLYITYIVPPVSSCKYYKKSNE